MQAVVTNYLTLAGLPTQNVTVTVSDLTTPGTDPTAASALDQIQVSVSIPFSNVNWGGTSMFMPKNALLSATATWYSANAVFLSDEYNRPRGELTDGHGRKRRDDQQEPAGPPPRRGGR